MQLSQRMPLTETQNSKEVRGYERRDKKAGTDESRLDRLVFHEDYLSRECG